MAKKTSKTRTEALEDESQGTSQAESQGRSAGSNRAISKAEAIRRAIAAGYDQPEAGTGYIRSTFGIEVTKPHFSASKSNFKSARRPGIMAGGTRKPERRRGGAEKGRDVSTRNESSAPGAGEGDLLAALEAMKPLVASMGADKIYRLVDLLG